MKMAFNNNIAVACTALASLARQGFVVTAMRVGNFLPVITVETPQSPALLDSVPVITVNHPQGRYYMQTVRYRNCLVEWLVKEPTSITSATSAHIPSGFALVPPAGSTCKGATA